MRIAFTAYGHPVTQGNKKPFVVNGRAVMAERRSKELHSWRDTIAASMRAVYQGPMLTGSLVLTAKFYFVRPKSHMGTGRNEGVLKDSAPAADEHESRPDLDKLLRAAKDALSKVLYRDDSQISQYGKDTGKFWCAPGEPERVEIEVVTKSPAVAVCGSNNQQEQSCKPS